MSEKITCFFIDGKQLYLDHVLVEFNDIPIFFICRHNTNYFIALCYDVENMAYYIAPQDRKSLQLMLFGKIPMASLFTTTEKIWDVESGDSIETDSVQTITSAEIDKALLPAQDAVYEIIDEETQKYAAHLSISDTYRSSMLPVDKGYAEYSEEAEEYSESLDVLRLLYYESPRKEDVYAASTNNAYTKISMTPSDYVIFINKIANVSKAA